MLQCTNCGAELPQNARFCGNCGNVPDSHPNGMTMMSNPGIVNLKTAPEKSIAPGSQPGIGTPVHWTYDGMQNSDDHATIAMEDEEEEKRRRAALLGLGLLGVDAVQGGSNVPMVQGTPQVGNVPSVPGVPFAAGNAPGAPPIPAGSAFKNAPHLYAPNAPHAPYAPHPPHTPLPKPPHANPPPGPKGCAPIVLILAILIPFVFIGTFITLGLTIFAPDISLSGGSDVPSGGTLPLHGSHFLPGGGITLTLDGSIPLFVKANPQGTETAHALNGMGAQNMSAAPVFERTLAGSSTVNADGSGAFSITISVDPGWSVGKHTIEASESITHRSAQLSFTITSNGSGPTPTPSPTQTATATPSPSVTATKVTTGLSCINPSTLTPGPVSANYPKTISKPVTLCAQGTGSVNWTASWDTSKFSWLTLSQKSGQIGAPGQAQITVNANTSQLGAGIYSATILFTSTTSSVTESLTVNLTVQAACIKSSKSALTFTAVLKVNEAAPQTLSLTNCGAIGTWARSVATTDGSSWLSASPTSGTLNANASSTITISASTLNSSLEAGTYTGKVTFTSSSSSVVVNVTFNVEATPLISVKPTSIVVSRLCSGGTPTYTCTVSLTNNSQVSSLSWTSSTSSTAITLSSASGTLKPGQTLTVNIFIDSSKANNCPSGKTSVTFSGPGNNVKVTLSSCPEIQTIG